MGNLSMFVQYLTLFTWYSQSFWCLLLKSQIVLQVDLFLYCKNKYRVLVNQNSFNKIEHQLRIADTYFIFTKTIIRFYITNQTNIIFFQKLQLCIITSKAIVMIVIWSKLNNHQLFRDSNYYVKFQFLYLMLLNNHMFISFVLHSIIISITFTVMISA